jgi:hypothetical protein
MKRGKRGEKATRVKNMEIKINKSMKGRKDELTLITIFPATYSNSNRTNSKLRGNCGDRNFQGLKKYTSTAAITLSDMADSTLFIPLYHCTVCILLS